MSLDEILGDPYKIQITTRNSLCQIIKKSFRNTKPRPIIID